MRTHLSDRGSKRLAPKKASLQRMQVDGQDGVLNEICLNLGQGMARR